MAKIALAFKRVTFILPILLCFGLVTEHYIYEYICFIDLSTVVFKRARSFFRDKMKIKYRPFLSVAAQALYLYLRVISFVIHSYSVADSYRGGDFLLLPSLKTIKTLCGRMRHWFFGIPQMNPQ